MEGDHTNSYFCIIVLVILWFQEYSEATVPCVLQKRCSSKCCKIYRKALVPEPVLN